MVVGLHLPEQVDLQVGVDLQEGVGLPGPVLPGPAQLDLTPLVGLDRLGEAVPLVLEGVELLV